MDFIDTLALRSTYERSSGPVSVSNTELKTPEGSPRFVIVERRRLWRDCLIRCFGLLHPDARFAAYDAIDECLESLDELPGTDAFFLCVGSNVWSADEIQSLVDKVDPVPVVLLSDTEDVAQFVTARQCGAKGCLSANLTLDMVFAAMKMAAAGGFVMSPDGVDAMQQVVPKPQSLLDGTGAALTSRQTAVAEGLRQGKPNKIIAYELGLCENTVKVHVRSILTKLNATNRTEAAFKLNEQGPAHAPD
jgi:DNA-binding NarL/FixJ family response regulator